MDAFADPDEIDVQHHDDEHEEHRHRADIDDGEDHRQELGAGEHEQARGAEEGEDEEQHRMHRVARRNHHCGGGHRDRGEQVEGEDGDSHRRRVASASRLAAIALSQRSPLASRRSLS